MRNENSDEFSSNSVTVRVWKSLYIKRRKVQGTCTIRSHRLTFVSVLVFTNLTIAGLMLGTLYSDLFAYAVRANVTASNPIVVDPELDVELYFKGLRDADFYDIS